MTYVDAGPDPRFPDRPTHPDFQLLARIVQDLDGDSGRWEDNGEGAFHRRNNLDSDSLMYLARRRVQRALAVLDDPDSEAGRMAMYLDAFATGYEAARQRHPTLQLDGNHRRQAAGGTS